MWPKSVNSLPPILLESWSFQNVLLSPHFVKHTHRNHKSSSIKLSFFHWNTLLIFKEKRRNSSKSWWRTIVPMLWETLLLSAPTFLTWRCIQAPCRRLQELNSSRSQSAKSRHTTLPRLSQMKKAWETATSRWCKGRSYTPSVFVWTVKSCLLQALELKTLFIPQGWSTCERSRALFLLGWTSLCRRETAKVHLVVGYVRREGWGHEEQNAWPLLYTPEGWDPFPSQLKFNLWLYLL